MRFSDLCEKEVISENDCRCLGNICDLDIDPDCGAVTALVGERIHHPVEQGDPGRSGYRPGGFL
jgi:sporulation protein YlmC with PRC-barrel domain